MGLYRKMEQAVVEVAYRTGVPPDAAKAAQRLMVRHLFADREWVLDPPDLFHLARLALTEERGPALMSAEFPAQPRDAAPAARYTAEVVSRLTHTIKALEPVELYAYYLRRQGLTDEEASLVLDLNPEDIRRLWTRALKKFHSVPAWVRWEPQLDLFGNEAQTMDNQGAMGVAEVRPNEACGQARPERRLAREVVRQDVERLPLQEMVGQRAPLLHERRRPARRAGQQEEQVVGVFACLGEVARPTLA
jgi:hypothetical protein